MKILAVDDEKLALELLVSSIKEVLPEAQIYQTNKSKEALNIATNNMIDIVFCDINMPEIDGISLAKQLKKTNKKINVIFVTGYSEYMKEAFSLHASGYITKPVTSEDIKKEVDNLLYPIQTESTGIYAKTFGNFELFVNGKPVFFAREKSKEMLAYLIDRRGAVVNKKEIMGILFEDREYDRELQGYFTKIYSELIKGLKEVGAESIIVKGYNRYGIDKTKFGSDLFDYLAGDPSAINSFCGEYMIQYSWSEYSIGSLYE